MIKLEESISTRRGVSCFPSRQCSIRLCSAATTNLSHSSLSRKTKVQSFSLSLSPSPPQPAIYDRAPHTTHTPPSKHLNYNEVQQRSSTIYKPTIFSINHRSAPWLVTTPIIDLGLDILVDISCIGMLCKHRYTSRHYQARVSEDLLIENDASPGTVKFTRTKKDRSRAGESLNLR